MDQFAGTADIPIETKAEPLSGVVVLDFTTLLPGPGADDGVI
jgi:hypothetical protein